MKIFESEGKPSGEYWRSLVNFKDTMPRFKGKPWHQILRKRLRERGVEALNLCTALDPSERITA